MGWITLENDEEETASDESEFSDEKTDFSDDFSDNGNSSVQTNGKMTGGYIPSSVDYNVPVYDSGISTPDFLKTLEEGFKEFFEKEVPANPLKAEYLIPTFIGELLSEGKMSVKVLRTNDTWYGMTYKEDVAAVKESFSKMLENGTYKGDLFSDL